MANTLADAYVRIRPDARGFQTDLTTKLTAAAAVAGEKAGGEAGNRINARLRALNLPNINLRADPKQALLEIDRLKAKLAEVARSAPTASLRVDAKAGIAELEKFKVLLELKAHEAGEAGGKAASRGFGDGFNTRGSIFAITAGFLASRLVLIGAAAATATPAVINLAASLAPLAGLIIAAPAGIFAAAAAFGVLKLATAGVGKAIKDGVAENWKAWNKDVKNMPPSAIEAASAIVRLRDRFKELRQAVASKFFAGFQQQINELSHRTLPILERKLPQIAGSMNLFARSILNAAHSAPFIKGLSAVLGGTAAGIHNAAAGAGLLTKALGRILQVGAPLLAKMGTGFTQLSIRFNKFITQAQNSGQLAKWLTNAVHVLAQLGTIALNVGKIIKSFLQASQADGTNLLTTITNLTTKVAAFFNSAKGQHDLETIFKVLDETARAIGASIKPILATFGDAIGKAGPQILALLPVLFEFIDALSPLLALFAETTRTLLTALIPALRALSDWLRSNPAVVKALGIAIAILVTAYKGWVLVLALSTAKTKEQAAAFVAQKVAMAAWTATVKVATLVWRALSLAFSTSPIGFIITVLALLVIGVIAAYKHFAWLRTIVQGALKGIMIAGLAIANFFVANVWNPLRVGINAVGVAAIWLWRHVFEPVWHGILLAVKVAVFLIKIYLAVITFEIKVVAAGFMWLWRNIVAPVWHGISIIFLNAWNYIRRILNGAIADIRFVGGVFLWLWRNVVAPVWHTISLIIQSAWGFIRRIFNGAIADIRFVGSVFMWLWHNIVVPVWRAIYTNILSFWGFVRRVFNGAIADIRFVGSVFMWLWHNVVVPVWRAISTVISTAWHFINNSLFAQMIHVVRDLIPAAFNAAVSAIKTAWNKIKAFVHDPISFVINTVYNKGVVPVWNFVASKVGLKPLLPMTFKAQGGLLRGPGTGTSDSIPAMLSDGEFVVNAKSTKKNRSVLEAINSDRTNVGDMGIAHYGPGSTPQYCAGGQCKTSDYKPNKHMYAGGWIPEYAAGGAANVAAIIKATKAWLWAQKGKPYSMGAAGPNAWDCSGLVGGALKMINGRNPNGRIFSTATEGNGFFKNGFGGVNDLNVGWVGGSGGAGHTVGSLGGLNFEATPPRVLIGRVNMTPGSSYFKHKGHATVGGGANFTGGGGHGASWCIPNPIRFLFDKLFDKLLGNPIAGWVASKLKGVLGWNPEGRGASSKFVSSLKAKADSLIPAEICAFGPTGPSNGNDSGGAARWAPVLLHALDMLHLPHSWLGPLETLISRESGGNPNAINRTDSNAMRGDPSRGLMQTIGATFNRFKYPGYNNIYGPLDNVLAGLRYIKGTYGSIFNVQQAVGSSPKGYDNGGMLPTGWSTIYNGTGKPENVSRTDKMDEVIEALGDVVTAIETVAPDLGKVLGSNSLALRAAARNRG